MRLPPLQFSDPHFYVSGKVTIHPSAAIAPSVMLQADPDSQLIIAAGVCIGAGSVLHAHQGILLIEAGAALGSGVLILGSGKIGQNACIGAMSTLIDSSIEAHQSIPPGSLIGDSSRQIIQVEATEVSADPETAATAKAQASDFTDSQSAATEGKTQTEDITQAESTTQTEGATQVVYGRAYLEKIMVTMFPHRQK